MSPTEKSISNTNPYIIFGEGKSFKTSKKFISGKFEMAAK